MTSLSRGNGRRFHLLAMSALVALIAVATMPARGSAQQSAPPSGTQGGGMGSMQGGGGGGANRMAALMQGITLTDAQQKSIDGIPRQVSAAGAAGPDRPEPGSDAHVDAAAVD